MLRVITILFVVAAASALSVKQTGDYHDLVGIKLAERIRQAEQAVDFDGARIIGGSPAPLGAYPYMGGLVVFLASGSVSVCGSSLLSNTRALTAAHCWRSAANQAVQFTVVLGSHYVFTGGHRVNTSDVVMHPNYSTFGWSNDIAVIRMGWVPLTNLIHPISLPTGALQSESFTGVLAQAAGYGITGDGPDGALSPDQFLSHITVPVISNEECFPFLPIIEDSTICTFGIIGIGPCSSDSGGPLSVIINGRPVLIGVVSFTTGPGCEHTRATAYARVTSFLPWIQANL